MSKVSWTYRFSFMGHNLSKSYVFNWMEIWWKKFLCVYKHGSEEIISRLLGYDKAKNELEKWMNNRGDFHSQHK